MVIGLHLIVVTGQKKIQHLFLRAGFGETPAGILALRKFTLPELVSQLFSSSEKFRDLNYLPFPLNESQERKGASPFQVLKMILKSRQDMEELNSEWLFKMTYTPAVLREKLTFFWHNHFATSVPFAYLMQVQNNTLRRLALGPFGDLLHAIAKDPAMLLYLNNQQNKKDHPNENFAREVMELFTLGIGHYTEQDIREAARAFTGWTVNARGEYEFQKEHHDDGIKEFLGRKGNFNGEDILNILLEEKQTARFLVSKIYREYVNPTVPKERLETLSLAYYNSGYHTGELLRSIFNSDWFYDEENIGVKICSPVELIVRYKKLVDLQFKKNKTLVNLQYALGQVLFFPPNVAGWKGGTQWIDSTSLLVRLSLARYLVQGIPIGLKSRPAFEAPPDESHAETLMPATSDWGPLTNFFKDKGRLTESLPEHFIQCDPQDMNENGFAYPGAETTDEKDLIRSIVNILSMPQFQLI